jgi:hypothetical protein
MNLVEGLLLCTGGVAASYLLPVLLRHRRPGRAPVAEEIPWGPLRLWGPLVDDPTDEDRTRVRTD